jgi:tripartite-type tricarboxylate transporter receptor subunit TctC
VKRLFVPLAAGILLSTLVMAGCTPSTPAPTPTKPAAAPTTAAAPTKPAAAPTTAAAATKPAAATTPAAGATAAATKPAATAAATAPAAATKPAAQPTGAATQAAATKKSDFPQKGKAIQVVVPYPAGGSVDAGTRLLAPLLERELGTSVEIVNKAGAAGQVGITDVALGRPDGYTIGAYSIPGNNYYLDPRRQAAYTRESFQPVSMHVKDVILMGVKTDSPYKSMKDLVDAAKASPNTIKVGSVGIASITHLALAALEKETGAKFNIVQFDGDAPGTTALLGGHIDVMCAGARAFVPSAKAGQTRVFGVMDRQETKFFPGAKTAESEGYRVYFASARGYVLPAKSPMDIVTLLNDAMKKSIQDPEHIKKLDEAGLEVNYMGPEDFGRYWAETDRTVEPLMKELSKES